MKYHNNNNNNNDRIINTTTCANHRVECMTRIRSTYWSRSQVLMSVLTIMLSLGTVVVSGFYTFAYWRGQIDNTVLHITQTITGLQQEIRLLREHIPSNTGVNHMADYYLRADGTALNKTTATGPSSDASKCMTIAVHNVDTFAPGDVIHISDLGGRHLSILEPPSSGASGNPITYQAAAGEAPIISGSDDEGVPSRNRGSCVCIENKDYITVDNVECRYTGNGGEAGEAVKVEGTSTGAIIKNCNLHHNEILSVRFGDTATGTVQECDIHHDSVNGVSITSDAVATIRGGAIHDTPRGVTLTGTESGIVDDVDFSDISLHMVNITTGSSHVEVKNCSMDGTGASNAVRIEGSGTAYVHNNDMWGAGYFVRCYSQATGGVYETVTVEDNEMRQSTSYGVEIRSGAIAVIRGNTFTHCASFSVSILDGATGYIYRNRFAHLEGQESCRNNVLLSGLFYVWANVSDCSSTYNYAVTGTVNPLSVIANGYVNHTGRSTVFGQSKIFNLHNMVGRAGGVYDAFQGISNAVVTNCISETDDLPAGNGNHTLVDLSTVYQSEDDTDPLYALPTPEGLADGGGVDPGISAFATYYNDVPFDDEHIFIGAMGLLDSPAPGDGTDLGRNGNTVSLDLSFML